MMGMDMQIIIMEDGRAESAFGACDINVDIFHHRPSIGNGGNNDSISGPGFLAYTFTQGLL